MKTRSLTGPVLLVAIGLLFLVNNIWPEVSLWSVAWNYWPVLLILAGVVGLVEALYQAARGVPNPSRPFSGAGVFWFAMLIAFVNWAAVNGNSHLLSFATGGVLLGNDYTYDVNETGASAGVTRLVLDNIHGSVTMRGETGGDVRVTGHRKVRAFTRDEADRANTQGPLRVVRDGDRLIVRVESPAESHVLFNSADLDITVPRGLNIEATGRNGDFTADDLAGSVDISGRGDLRLTNIGKDVRIDSSHGLVRVRDVAGKVDVKGSGGDLQIENIKGEVTVHGEYSGTTEFQAIAAPVRFTSNQSDFRVEAIPGSFTFDPSDLKMSNATGPVRLRTGSRDMKITDVTDTLEIVLKRGDIDVTQTVTPLPKMDVHTNSGDVTLAIPEQATFDLDGRTAHGDASNDFGEPLKDEDQGRAATIRGRKGSGPEIRIGTERGSLTVKKS